MQNNVVNLNFKAQFSDPLIEVEHETSSTRSSMGKPAEAQFVALMAVYVWVLTASVHLLIQEPRLRVDWFQLWMWDDCCQFSGNQLLFKKPSWGWFIAWARPCVAVEPGVVLIVMRGGLTEVGPSRTSLKRLWPVAKRTRTPQKCLLSLRAIKGVKAHGVGPPAGLVSPPLSLFSY